MKVTGVGLPRLARGARGGHRALRRQHLVRRGARAPTGEVLVLDAGTGMRPLGLALAAEGAGPIHVLLSHLHLDHLQGLGFFRPLFETDAEIHIWGPASPVQSLAERIATYLSPPLFPVRLADIPATITFHDAPEEPIADRRPHRAGVARHPPGPDRRLPDRGGRAQRRVPPRPRARPRRRRGPAAHRLAQRVRAGPRRRRPAPRRAVRRRRVPAATSAGGTPPSATWWRSPRRPTSSSWCCSTTTRGTPTTRWRPSSTRPAGSGATTAQPGVLGLGRHDDRPRPGRRAAGAGPRRPGGLPTA